MADGSSKRGVNIPVEVTGADAAQAELRDTKAAVEGVGAGGAKAAGGAAQLGDAAGKATAGAKGLGDAASKGADTADALSKNAKKGAESLFDFDNKGEKAAKTLLGLLNPQLASVADGLLDLLGGLAKISPLLLGIGGAAAVFQLISARLSEASEKAERFRKELERQAEVERKARADTQSLRATVADDLARAGVFGADVVAGATARTGEIARSGVRSDLARNAAVAEAIAAQGGDSFNLQAFLAGAITSGKGKVELGDSNASARQAIAAAQAQGGTAEAQQAAAEYINSTFATAIGELLEVTARNARDDVKAAIDKIVSQVIEGQGFSEADRAAITDKLRAGVAAGDDGLRRLIFPLALGQGGDEPISASGKSQNEFREAIAESARIIQQALSGRSPTETRAVPASQPTVIQNITNIGTVLQSSDRLGDYTFNPALDRESFRR